MNRIIAMLAVAACALGSAPGESQEPVGASSQTAADLLPFPTCADEDDARIDEEYAEVTVDHEARGVSFRILVPKNWERADVQSDLTQLSVQPQTVLRCLAPEGGDAALEVVAFYLQREVAPVDWLDGLAQSSNLRLIGGRVASSGAGGCPDWLLEAEGGKTLVRMAAFRSGRVLYLISGSAKTEEYPRWAEVFGVAVASWRPLRESSGGRYVESLAQVEVSEPVRASVRHLESWTSAAPKSPDLGLGGYSFRWGGEEGEGTRGLIAVKFFDKERFEEAGVMDVEDYIARFEQDLADAGVVVGEMLVDEDFHAGGVIGDAVRQVRRGTMGEGKVEARMILAEREDCWFMLEMLGPGRESDPEAWAINRRAFEVMFQELQFKP